MTGPPATPTRADPQLAPAELAARYGLRQSGARPPLTAYARELWRRRHFILTYASARNSAQYTDSVLGQLWQVLTPLLNAAVYYFIFGVLLKTSRGVTNYVAFLVAGIFIFNYTQRAVMSGANAITGNLALIRALHFPRATLPLASTVVEFQQLLFSVAILCVIVLATGEPLTWNWLLLPVGLALQTVFNVGLALTFARITENLHDTAQFLPFLLRTWTYVSGVFFSIQVFAKSLPPWLHVALLVNPGAVYIEVARDALLASHGVPPALWALAAFWAVLASSCGFVYFWRAEERYGRG